MKIKSRKKLNIINVINALILGVYGLYETFISLALVKAHNFNILVFSSSLAFAAFLVLNAVGYYSDKKDLFIVGAICGIISMLCSNIYFLIYGYPLWKLIITAILELAYFALLIIAENKKNNMSFTLSVIAAICILIDWVSFDGTVGIMAIVMIVSAVLLGITFANISEDKKLVDYSLIKYYFKEKKSQKTVSKAANDIWSLKELLDAGAITKKEFEKQKEKILKNI